MSSFEENKYWPFSVLPPERQTEQHRREIRFLELAYHAGYGPYTSLAGDYGATGNDRGGHIVVRGSKNRWELILGTKEKTLLSAYLDDFDAAAAGVLQWLRGGTCREVLALVQGHLIAMGGREQGIVLYEEDVSEEKPLPISAAG